jgi:hypothetical protein
MYVTRMLSRKSITIHKVGIARCQHWSNVLRRHQKYPIQPKIHSILANSDYNGDRKSDATEDMLNRLALRFDNLENKPRKEMPFHERKWRQLSAHTVTWSSFSSTS